MPNQYSARKPVYNDELGGIEVKTGGKYAAKHLIKMEKSVFEQLLRERRHLTIGITWKKRGNSKLRFYAVVNALNSDRKKGITTQKIPLHRLILGIEGTDLRHFDVDHINGDSLDNRKENLRIADRSQNCQNLEAHNDNKTGYVGVYQTKTTVKGEERYTAQLWYRGRWYPTKRFASVEEAARHRDKLVLENYSEEDKKFARLNFPEKENGIKSQ